MSHGPSSHCQCSLRFIMIFLALMPIAAGLLSSTARADEPVAAPASKVGIVDKKPAGGIAIPYGDKFLVPYTQKIPGTEISFEMVPVPGGKFMLGSPAGEKGRNADEGPQVEIELPPYWVGKYEVTWGEYFEFMGLYDSLKSLDGLRTFPTLKQDKLAKQQKTFADLIVKPEYSKLKAHLDRSADGVDAVTAPTKLHAPAYTFENGDDPKQPAVTMSQFAARQYTKWLSLLTGQSFRLPTEAEWEYACRAGTKTAYSFGEDPAQLGDYGWFADNAEEKQHKVGEKKPNPWGLYDMHGNVAEWVLDAHSRDGYQRIEGKTTPDWQSILWPKELNGRVVRGGQWETNAEDCRSAARLASEEAWRDIDPCLPKSPWWLTDDPARGVGFRIVRVVEPMTADQKKMVYETDVEELALDVADKIAERRGIRDQMTIELPKTIEQLEAAKKILEQADQ